MPQTRLLREMLSLGLKLETQWEDLDQPMVLDRRKSHLVVYSFLPSSLPFLYSLCLSMFPRTIPTLYMLGRGSTAELYLELKTKGKRKHLERKHRHSNGLVPKHHQIQLKGPVAQGELKQNYVVLWDSSNQKTKAISVSLFWYKGLNKKWKESQEWRNVLLITELLMQREAVHTNLTASESQLYKEERSREESSNFLSEK